MASQEKPLSAWNAADEYSFLLETLSADAESPVEYRQIHACKPVKLFSNLSDLQKFIESNLHELQNSEAGFAGYISYEGDLEFALYSEICFEDFSPAGLLQTGNSQKFQIQEPDPNYFIESVIKCQKYIEEGDIYQANLSRKFVIGTERALGTKDCFHLYKKLCASNPAPYAGFMNFGKYCIISSSPESFLKIYQEESHTYISSSPIKGTAGLLPDSESSLENSTKDQAEHIMIVDLIRNDLAKLCKTNSIEVKSLMQKHKFKNLYHLISTVSGELREALYEPVLNFPEIIKACFPGGSITGAPKLRSMSVIQQLEPCPRGPYTGIMGYYKFKEAIGEFSILIRSLILDKSSSELSCHSGAGITAYSNPAAELEETSIKIKQLIECLR
jgi:para-aminobenzoate synthetase component 1